VQVRRAVAVRHALGVAGRTRGVAHGSRGQLVDLRPVERLRMAGNEVFVPYDRDAVATQWRQVDLPGHHDRVDAGRSGAAGANSGARLPSTMMTRSSAWFPDIGELLDGQTRVQGVQHRAHRRDGAVGLNVLLVVPHERGDALVAGDPTGTQRVRQLGRSASHLRERADLDAPIRLQGPHARRAMNACAVTRDGSRRELDVHHRALHVLPQGVNEQVAPTRRDRAGAARWSL
jgi:hypothetical protein